MNSTISSIVFALPPREALKWPSQIPPTVPVPASVTSPFIHRWWDVAMDVRTPLTIAAVYAAVVHAWNHYNRTHKAELLEKNKRPDAFVNSRFFKTFVLLHNVGLCIYSVWTFIGMTSSIRTTMQELASSSTFQCSWNLFSSRSELWRALCSLSEGIWENGLSYYGFYFYLSKFYEVLDTAIILLKGKESSLLQTYHHSGAMLSMWSGLRFASPPIWIFVVFNSLIHSIMYFYYTLTALKIKVPLIVKRTLTTAQICQFIFGGSGAVLHIFVSYFDPQTKNYCSCIGDFGQTFAVLFNVMYLAPLTWLFVSFWIESYVNRNQRIAERKANAKKAQ